MEPPREYPLAGLDLDFSLYKHTPPTAGDILVNHIVENYMFPRRVDTSLFVEELDVQAGFFGPVKARDRELGLDLQLLSDTLVTHFDMCPSFIYRPCLISDARGLYTSQWISLGELVLDLVQRHYIETSIPGMRIWLMHFRQCHLHESQHLAQTWKKDMRERWKAQSQNSRAFNSPDLYPGPSACVEYTSDQLLFSLDPYFLSLPLASASRLDLDERRTRREDFRDVIKQNNINEALRLHWFRCVAPRVSRRTTSEPPPGTWAQATLSDRGLNSAGELTQINYPRLRLTQIDKTSRRRSLSRTHIKAMFRNKPLHWMQKPAGPSGRPRNARHHCTNCAQEGHRAKNCKAHCGWCNLDSHKALQCPMKPTNRCKCTPFPQNHPAKDCPIPCSRQCGSPYYSGHFKHRNAIGCTWRCCMCGLRGHAGKDCKFIKCRCGEQHLGQDCTWKVECRVKGCDRYLCGLHCKECGSQRERGKPNVFVGGRCQACLSNSNPIRVASE